MTSDVHPSPERRVAAPPLAAVYGGGGLFGIGYSLGVAEALADRGIDLSGVRALGTSAGAWAAAGTARHLRFADALAQLVGRIPRVPDPRPGRLQRLAAELVGPDTRTPTVDVVACALPGFRRTVLSGADHPIADLVAASSAVPGLLAPQRIAGTRYVDGGVRSMASIDRAPAAAHLLVVLPMAGPMFGPFGTLVERTIRHELAEWTARNPGSAITVVRPTAELRALVRRPDQLFDAERARRAHDLAYRLGQELELPVPSTDGRRTAA
jgi:NTE family protein